MNEICLRFLEWMDVFHVYNYSRYSHSSQRIMNGDNRNRNININKPCQSLHEAGIQHPFFHLHPSVSDPDSEAGRKV